MNKLETGGSFEASKKPKRTNGNYCCVVGCRNSQQKNKEVKFHKFPVNNHKRRTSWIKAVNRQNLNGSLWNPPKGALVCSSHFVGGCKKDQLDSASYVPSIFPTAHVKAKTTWEKERNNRYRNREMAMEAKKQEQIMRELLEKAERTDSCETDEFDSTYDPNDDFFLDPKPKTMMIDEKTQTLFPEHKCGFIWICETEIVDNITSQSTMVQIQSTQSTGINTDNIKQRPKRNMNVWNDNRPQLPSPIQILSFAPRQFEAFTGISKDICQFLLNKLGNKVSDSRVLSREEKVAMFFVKLKLNVSFVALSAMFNVSERFVSSTFGEVITPLSVVCNELVIWFDKKTIQARMPPQFKALFGETCVIIDATEVECARQNTNKKRAQTYSNYKGRFTVKFLVGCAPSGEVTFISKGFGGRTTEMEITIKSGFINLVDQGDVILADKGFPHIEARVLEAGGTLIMPPFKRGGRQFSQAQNEEGYKIACVRVHVERAIGRLKRFMVLDVLPCHMLKYIDRLLIIIAGVCNLMPDLINQETDDDVR